MMQTPYGEKIDTINDRIFFPGLGGRATWCSTVEFGCNVLLFVARSRYILPLIWWIHDLIKLDVSIGTWVKRLINSVAPCCSCRWIFMDGCSMKMDDSSQVVLMKQYDINRWVMMNELTHGNQHGYIKGVTCSPGLGWALPGVADDQVALGCNVLLIVARIGYVSPLIWRNSMW